MDNRVSGCRVWALCCLAVVVTACADQPPLVAGTVRAAVEFPVEAAGWWAADDGEVFDTQTIFSYIDGHAEVYLAYGMKRCLSRRYTGPDGEPDIVLDLYELASPADAFGVFTLDQDGEVADVGQGASYRHGWLSFWQGSWFGSVYAEGESERSRDAVSVLGRAAAAAIGETGDPPALVGELPARGLEAGSVRYLHAQEILNSVVYLGFDNPFVLAPDVNVAVGRYELPEGAAWLLLADYPDDTHASRAEATVRAAGIAASRQGSRLTAVLEPEPVSAAEAILAAAKGGAS